MADPILSQAEVDVLVRGVSEGKVDTRSARSSPSGIRAYDLAVQERFLQDRMPTLEIVNDRFVRLFQVSISAVLRKPVAITPEPIQITKFGEFIKKISPPSSLHLIRMDPLRGQVLVVMDSKMVYLLLDVLFGGRGQADFKTEGRDFTPIEQRFMRKVVDLFSADLQKAWSPVHPVQIGWVRSEINPQLVMVAAPTEAAVSLTYKLEIGGQAGTLMLCLPYPTIEPIREKLYGGFQASPLEVDRSWTDRFRARLEDAYVRVQAELGTVGLSVREVIQLKAGDVIVLDQSVESDLMLMVEGRPKYFGRIGMYHSSPAFQVSSIIRTPKEDSYGE
jgi:flagellar motor switch protein FliM